MEQPFDERETWAERKAREEQEAEEREQASRRRERKEYSRLVGDPSMRQPDAGDLTDEQREALREVKAAKEEMDRLATIDSSPSWDRPDDYDPERFAWAKERYARAMSRVEELQQQL
jgi:hypothetical protein